MTRIAGYNKIVIAKESSFGEFVANASEFKTIEPYDFKPPKLEQEYFVPKTQRPYFGAEQGLLGAKSGELLLKLPLRGSGAPQQNSEALPAFGLSDILEASLPGVFRGSSTRIAEAQTGTSAEIFVLDGSGIMAGQLIAIATSSGTTILRTVVDISLSDPYDILYLSRPVEHDLIQVGDYVYASIAHFAARNLHSVDTSLCAEISDINQQGENGHTWRLVGLKAETKLSNLAAGKQPLLETKFHVHSWETPSSPAVAFSDEVQPYPASPRPLWGIAGGFFVNGQPVAIADAEIEFGQKFTAAPDIGSQEGRSGFILVGLEPSGSFTPFYALDWDNKFLSQQEFSVEVILGSAAGNAVGIYMPRVVVSNAPELDDSNGLLTRPVKFRVLSGYPLPDLCISFS